MARLVKREVRSVEPADVVEPMDVFGPIDRTFEHLIDLWPVLPLRRSVRSAREWLTDSFIRVDEFHEDGMLVIRAELPGIDPDKDVELTVSDGMLRISAERREEEKVEKRGYVRQELHRGSFERVLTLPEGVTESDVTASYTDGILEIRVPTPKLPSGTKIPITKTEK
jgi:HSP20 family protein